MGKTADINMNTENVAGGDVINSVDPEGDTTLETSDKIMLEIIDEPPDGFFDDLLKDDFLDSLAVVDAWNPDADDSYGSDTVGKKQHNAGREADESNRQSALGNIKRKDGGETADKNAEGRRRRDSSGHRRKGDHRSTERRVLRRGKGGTDEHLHHVEKAVEKRYRRVGEKSRERSRERREEREKVSRDNKQRNISRKEKGSRDSTERSIHRGNKNSGEKSSEISTHTRSEDKDKNIETNISSSKRDKSVGRLEQKEDRSKNIEKVSRRYSDQYRISNKDRPTDGSAKGKDFDLRFGITDVCVEGKGSSESLRKEKSSDSVANRAVHTEFVHKCYDLEKGMSRETKGMVKHGGGSTIIEEVVGSQSHVLTSPSNPPLNSTKLDTCIKELDDLVPPGTEDSFICYTRDEVAEIAEVKVDDNKEKINPLTLRSEKSSKHLVEGMESPNKDINVICRKNDEHKILESIKNEKVSSYIASLHLHKGTERMNSSHERKRSECNTSEGRKHASSRDKERYYLYEEGNRRHLKSSSEEKKRHSSSLERVFEESRMKNELFNEKIRKRRECCSRSQSKEKWQHHNDLHRLKRRRNDWNDSRRLQSGSRDKKLELLLGREGMGRSRSRDRHYGKVQNDIRQSQSWSRDKQPKLSEGQERVGRSRSRDRQYRKFQIDIRRLHSGSRDEQHEFSLGQERMERSRSRERQYRKASSEDRWMSDIGAQTLRRKKDVQNDSRSFVRSSLPVRISRSHNQDKQLRAVTSSKYRNRQGRYRRSVSQEREKRRSLSKNRLFQPLDKYKHRALNLSPVSVGRMSSSPSLSFELSPISSEREQWRSLSRSLSTERSSREHRRSYRGSSFSPVSSGSTFSRSGSFVSLSSLSDERRQPRRKRSPFWKEIERTFAKELHRNMYNQSAEYLFPSPAGTTLSEVQYMLAFVSYISGLRVCICTLYFFVDVNVNVKDNGFSVYKLHTLNACMGME